MFKQNKNFKHGFTIIEVVLVLAVAAMIFLMVFIALPAMQIMQRDTARANDVNRITTQLNSYQSNNNQKIPSMDKDAYVSGHADVDKDVFKSAERTSWAYFYDAYLIGTDTKQKFADHTVLRLAPARQLIATIQNPRNVKMVNAPTIPSLNNQKVPKITLQTTVMHPRVLLVTL